jgi:lactonase
MHEYGHIRAFNRRGIPIGQLLMPGPNDGHFLRTTSLAIKPRTMRSILSPAAAMA